MKIKLLKLIIRHKEIDIIYSIKIASSQERLFNTQHPPREPIW